MRTLLRPIYAAAFAVGILVSLIKPEKAAYEAYDAKERRMIMGVE